MSDANQSPLEQVLRLCARQAPLPWYPRAFVRETGVSGEDVSVLIEHLLLDGLLARTAGTDSTGPGLVLTPLGSKTLNDPEALERLRKGRPIAPTDRGGMVREALSRQARPYVSWTLLALNVLAFLYGIYLAANGSALQQFLTGLESSDSPEYRRFYHVLMANGSITAESWLRGEWWRALSSCFVHIGLLHLFLNMYILYTAGGFLEQVWGRGRFLTIYLISGIVGAGVGLAHHTDIYRLNDVTPSERITGPLAGASAALCGILAAEAIWVWLNGRYLPRSLYDRWRNNIFIQSAMIVFISFFPGISGWGHFGGAVAGALTALVLNYQRFGIRPWRWVVLVALVPISLLGIGEIQRMRMSRQSIVLVRVHFSDTSWEKVEELDYKKRFEHSVQTKLTDAERREYHEKVETLLDMDPGRRAEMKNAEVQNALDFLSNEQKQWSGYRDIVNQAGPYYQPIAIKMRDEDREAITAHLELFEMEEKCLRAGKGWKAADEAALREQQQKVQDFRKRAETPNEPDEANPKPRSDAEVKTFNKDYMPKMSRAKNEVAEVWDEANQQRLTEVNDRRPVRVEKTLVRIQAEREKLGELVKELESAGPFEDKDVEKARLTGRDYLREWATLFELAEQCLRSGDRWTAADTKKLETQLEKAIKAKEDWLALLQRS